MLYFCIICQLILLTKIPKKNKNKKVEERKVRKHLATMRRMHHPISLILMPMALCLSN